jgi:hypothetical protein
MEFYEANTKEKNQLIKEINNSFIQQGYLTFQDLKKKTGIKIKDIKNLLYTLGIAKQMGNKYLSFTYYPVYVPFEKLPNEIEDDLLTNGYCEGKYCIVVAKEFSEDYASYSTNIATDLLFNPKVVDAFLKAKQINTELKETDLDLGFDSGDPFEDLT